jgi:ABC-type transporter Mla subunit MlaD
MKSAVVILGFILTLSCTGNRRARNFSFIVQFAQAPGLKAGDEVRCLGVPVGKVESIKIEQPRGSASPLLDVSVSLNDDAVRVRQNDSFRVATTGLLGEAYLEMDPGKGDSASLQNLAANFQPLFEIATKLVSLPPGERERMAAEFLRVLDEASKKSSPKNPPKSNGEHK